jgi:hypothetical protein
MIVAVLLPSRQRPEQMTENVTGLIEQKPPKGVKLRVYLSIMGTDRPTAYAANKLAKKYKSIIICGRDPDTTSVEGWNLAYEAAAAGGADWFVLGADDVVWEPGWLDEALKVAGETGAQVIGLNDGHTDLELYGAHYMVTKEFLDNHLGGVMVPPEYKSWWFDREVCEIAREHNLYAPAYGAMARHLHPEWQTAEMDETYEEGYKHHLADYVIYTNRKLRR